MSTVHCAVCNTDITNIPEDYLKKQYYQEEYPDILIGPYCVSCFQKIRICCGCQKPFVKDETIKYFNKGLWYCEECSSHLTTCSKCNSICSQTIDINGEKLCKNCVKNHYFFCDYCEAYHPKDYNIFDNRVNRDAQLIKAQYPSIASRFSKGICKSAFERTSYGITPEDVKKCNHCGNLVSASQMENKNYCKACYGNFSKCSSCNERHPWVENYRVDDKSTKLCSSCFSKLPKCDVCSQATKKDIHIKGKHRSYHVCSSCYEYNKNLSECKMCLALVPLNDSGICETCSSYYSDDNKCDRCGTLKDFNHRCRSCGDRGTTIYNYSTKPHLHFNMIGEEIGELFFGIENEMTFPSESDQRASLKKLYKEFDPSILLAKSDGSIRGPGYELVTQPMTINFFNKLNVALWFGQARRDTSCGLHVHMDRKSFSSEVHLFKLINFIHNHEKFCNKIAGRNYTNFNTRLEDKPSKCTKKGVGSRYCRVNTSGGATIEIRMFAGCISEFELRYRVEFLHALWKFCKSASIKEANEKEFVSFVRSEQKFYHNLYRFLNGGK